MAKKALTPDIFQKDLLDHWKETYPDISDERARELLQDVRQELDWQQSNEDRRRYLETFARWDDDRHAIRDYLLYYLKKIMNIHNMPAEHPFYNRTISDIQMEIHNIGEIQTFMKYEGFLDLPYNRIHGSIKLLADIAAIYKALPGSANTQPDREPRPLAEAIHWKPGAEDELLRQLQLLKNSEFISYTNIKKVLSGDESAKFLKPIREIIALFLFWNEDKHIKGFVDRNGKQQYEEFITRPRSFLDRDGKDFNPGSFKAISSEKEGHIKESIPAFRDMLA